MPLFYFNCTKRNMFRFCISAVYEASQAECSYKICCTMAIFIQCMQINIKLTLPKLTQAPYATSDGFSINVRKNVQRQMSRVCILFVEKNHYIE